MSIHKVVTLTAVGIVSALAITVAGSSSAFAATKTWTGGGTNGNFSSADNWSPAGAPVNGDDVIMDTSNGIIPSMDIPNLSLKTLTFTGSSAISPQGSETLTITERISTNSGYVATGIPSVHTDVVLGGDTTITNVNIGGPGNVLNLNGHALRIATDSAYAQSTLGIGSRITGQGELFVNVGKDATLFLQNTNDYSGVTNIETGAITSVSNNSNTIFGSSDINVGPTAELNLYAQGGSWTFPNKITFAGAQLDDKGGLINDQMKIYTTESNQRIAVPNIVLNGDARFTVVNSGNAEGVVVDLAGIQANNHRIQYGGTNNSQYGEGSSVASARFINGPAPVVIGEDRLGAVADDNKIGVPNTGMAQLITGNPAIVAVAGLSAVGAIIFAARRAHQ